MTDVPPLDAPTPDAAPLAGLLYSQSEFCFRLPVHARGLGFFGPTIRGAFGPRFKATGCQVAHGQCGRCFLPDGWPFRLVHDRSVRDRKALQMPTARRCLCAQRAEGNARWRRARGREWWSSIGAPANA